MTFEEAFEHLNQMKIATVAVEMSDWHPAILGQMLLAVQTAKQIRYPAPHPNYHGPLEACLKIDSAPIESENETKFASAQINLASKQLTKLIERKRAG